MSLTVQPAPLMKKEPKANNARRPGSGKQPAGVARLILHVHDRNSSHVPAHDRQVQTSKPQLAINNEHKLIGYTVTAHNLK